MNNYPPGVTGHEYAIAGPDTEREVDEPCPQCGQQDTLFEFTYQGDVWRSCECGYEEDRTPSERDQWDEADERYQRMKEEGF